MTAQVRNTPEKRAAAPHEMPAHMVKPRAPSEVLSLPAAACEVLRQHGRSHLNMIQQRRFAGFSARTIEALERLQTARQAHAGRKQQQKREQDGNVERNVPERVPPHGLTLGARQRRASVIVRPGALVAEAKASGQHVLTLTSMIVHAAGELSLLVRTLGLLAVRSIKIKIRLGAAHQHIELGRSGPKRPQDAAPAIGRGPDQRSSMPRPLPPFPCPRKAIVFERALPRLIAPFDPQVFRWYAQ